LENLDLVKLVGIRYYKLEPIFTTTSAASKNDSLLKILLLKCTFGVREEHTIL